MPKGKPSKSSRKRYFYIQKTLPRKQQTPSLPNQPSQTRPLQTLSSITLSSNDVSSLLHDVIEENEKLQNEVYLRRQQQLMLQKQLMQQEELKQQLKEFASSLTWEQMMRNRDHEVYEKKVNKLREARHNNTKQWRALIVQ